MARFTQRPKRLSRRLEREKFERTVMPAAMMSLPLGGLAILASGVVYVFHGNIYRELLFLGAAVLVIPLVLIVYRFFRGHFSDQLDEP